MKHVVMFSGGVGSWATAKRVAERHGAKDLTLLFADTLIEDEDLYRFLKDAAANIGGQFVRIADGRSPWEVFRDEKYIGNTRADPCSRVLKRELLDKWRNENLTPDEARCYVGIDWSEIHRFERLKKIVAPWVYEAPLCEPPYLEKPALIRWLKREGIEPPRLYAMGFPHNNCGGFCVKAGQAQFALLLRKMPERYAEHEAKERELRGVLGNHSILRDRVGGTTKPMTLEEFRKRIEAKGEVDLYDWGGCGCAIE